MFLVGVLILLLQLYIALFTVAPGEDGTGETEVSGGGYARQTGHLLFLQAQLQIRLR